MIAGDFKCLIFPSCWRASYIWIKEAINLCWQMKLCSTTLNPLFLLRSHLGKKKTDEEMMMNHSSCGTVPIRYNLHFHVIICLSWHFQIFFRTTLILSPQAPAWTESNYKNGNSSGSFCLAFLGLRWYQLCNILGLSGYFSVIIIQSLSMSSCKDYGLKRSDCPAWCRLSSATSFFWCCMYW